MRSAKIRKASIEDVDSIVDLWKKLSVDQLSKDPYYKGKIDFGDEKTTFLNAIKNPKCCIFVAESENKVIGFIEIWLKEKDFYFFIDDYAYILHCFVEEEFRNYKLTRRLFLAAENWAKENDAKYLQADVFQHNSRVIEGLRYLGLLSYRTRLVKPI
ncbi:GNAT family N-acetyltransferase [Caloranaerobacter ferrireducens]|uniref:GNAT family N-acetyltransferase n=1 Tax=Caloranaerobacter ferrireducens TaxID=1323370 RepID=UPI000ACB3BD6|nr:GNAT family N-acetyltransferase [Caloranaerobacter ferrireducens]